MIYDFQCHPCELVIGVHAKAFHPPKAPVCQECFEDMDRVYGCMIDTSGCKDVDDIPVKDRIAMGAGDVDMTPGQAEAIERKHQQHTEQTRRDIAAGGNKGQMKKTHQIPAPLFHGKIKQTGDKNYWDSDKNLNRHKSCKVT